MVVSVEPDVVRLYFSRIWATRRRDESAVFLAEELDFEEAVAVAIGRFWGSRVRLDWLTA